MTLCRGNYDRGVNDWKKRRRIQATMALGNAGRIQPRGVSIGHVELDRHGLQYAEVIGTPAPKPDQKNSFHLLHRYARSAESVIYAQH